MSRMVRSQPTAPCSRPSARSARTCRRCATSDRMKPYGACRTCMSSRSGASRSRPATRRCKTARPNRTTASSLTSCAQHHRAARLRSTRSSARLHRQRSLRAGRRRASKVGLRHPRYENPRTHNPPNDDSHPFGQAQMPSASAVPAACGPARGGKARSSADERTRLRHQGHRRTTPVREANCVRCGQCVFECRSRRSEELDPRLRAARPDREHDLLVLRGRLLARRSTSGGPSSHHPLADRLGQPGNLRQGSLRHQFAHADDRLRSPLIKDRSTGKFREASWDERSI